MSWFPHILNPLNAAIAAVATVPLLVLLYFLKLRRKEIPVASTLLWKKAIQDLQVNSPFQKLRRNLLFLLQLFLLLLLCLALAQPVSSYVPGAGRINVILIDRSGSMNATDPALHGKTRLDEAKRQAKELIDSMKRGSTAMVIAFDDRAETVQSFTTDAVALKNAIDSIGPTDRRTRLKLAYQLAEAQIFDPQQLHTSAIEPDVYVFSDGRVLDGVDLAVHGNVELRPIGTADAANIAVVALSAKRNYENPAQVQVFARLANFGPKPISADVELRIAAVDPSVTSLKSGDYKLRGVATVDLLPQRWTDLEREAARQNEHLNARDSIEFSVDLATAAVIRVDQKWSGGDCLAADDSAQVVVPPPKPLSVLLVTEGDYFLERLLQSLNLKSGVTMSPTEYEAKLPTNFDLIIFDRAYAPDKLPAAGNFIFFGGLPPKLKLKQAMENGTPQFIDSTGVLDWQRNHPILKGISLHKLHALQAEKLDVPPDAQVLIDGVKGPLLVLEHEGHSTILAAAFDLLQSDWPTSPSFPVFMYNALQYMAVGTDMGLTQSYEPGATPSIPRSNLLEAGSMLSTASSNRTASGELKSFRLISPTGESKEVMVPPTGDVALPALNQVGVYVTDPPVPQFERMAVNLLDDNESNLLPVTDAAPGHLGTVAATAPMRSRLEWWWWIVACAAIPLLMIEWFVYTRRVFR